MPYRLLFVEDDKGQANALEDALSDWNAANPGKVFSLDLATNYDVGNGKSFSRFGKAQRL